MRVGGRLGWRLLIALAIALGSWAVASDATLGDGDARYAWAFMIVVGLVAGIPALLVVKALVREVPLRALIAGVLVGAAPAIALVVALGPVYQLQAPVDIGVFLLHVGTLPPLVEESVKAVGIAAVLLALGPVPLTRRHGKAIGAAVGLGFTISEVASYGAMAATGDAAMSPWGQLVLRMGLLGLTGHALTSALAGVGVADALGAGGAGLARRGRLLAPWLALAILTHGLMNTLGAWVLSVVSLVTAPSFDEGASTFLPLQAVWLGMVASVLVAQLWAAAVLWRRGRASRRPGGAGPQHQVDEDAAGPQHPVDEDATDPWAIHGGRRPTGDGDRANLLGPPAGQEVPGVLTHGMEEHG